MRTFLLVLSIITTSSSYAASDAEIKVTDTHIPTEERKAVPINDDERLSACESNVQNLLGRVEVLEHAVKELQTATGNSAALVPGVLPVGKENHAPAVASSLSEEKKDYDLALSALKESKFPEAENLFLVFMQKYPNSELMGNAYFWYADSFYRRGEFDKAAVHYLKGYKQFPKSPKAGDNLLKLALALGELKKYKDACAMLNKLEAEYKNRPASSLKRAQDAKLKYCK